MIESALLGAIGVVKWAGIGALGGATVYGVSHMVRGGPTKTVNDVFAACGLCNKGKDGTPKPWHVKKVQKTPSGTRLIMRFPYGKTLADVTRNSEAINTALGTDCAFTRDGSLLILDIPEYPLPSFISYSEKILELTRGTWRTVIGMGANGWVLHDFEKKPHLLLAGQTRFGKTESLKAILATLHLSHEPSEVEFVGIDMKPCSLEFRKFNGLWSELVSEPVQFLNVLVQSEKDMKERAEELARYNCSNVQQYERATGRKFKRRFIVVDEYGKSYGSEREDEIKNYMMQVCAMGAGLGVHVILCTQRPDADVIDGKIRANVGSILCMPVTTSVQSRVVLGHDGAELLPEIPGRAIYQAFGRETLIQAPYISDMKLSKMFVTTVNKYGNGEWKSFQARSGGVVDDYDG